MRTFTIAGITVLLLWLSPQAATAQRKYRPESPEVKAVVDRGVAYLTKKAGGGEKGVLAALAIAEASKRYDERVPKNNPVIQAAVAGIVKGVKGGSLLKAREVYHPSLAMILLCEVDDQKYKPEIEKILRSFEQRQLASGGYTYAGSKHWDTSQTQYVALAYYVARNHNIPVSLESADRILKFLVSVQRNNTWVYAEKEGGQRISIHAAVSGTVYLLGDLLQLQPRIKVEEQPKLVGVELPPSVSIFIKPTTTEGSGTKGGSAEWNREGPLIEINSSQFKECKSRANSTFESQFVIRAKAWGYYYLYALERYAYFRTQAEGDMGGRALKSWYDQGVEYIGGVQKKDGSVPEGPEPIIDSTINTAFAVMFLVRSSEILSLPPAASELKGGAGLAKTKGKKLRAQSNGNIEAQQNSKDLDDLIKDLGEDLTDDQLADLASSIKDAIDEYQKKPESSRGEARAFLKSLVSDRNYFKRLIAIKFLAGEQDLDNAPAMIYALGDPDERVCIEAHNGLRLISRKVDSISVPEDPELTDFIRVKSEWTNWLLKLRPGVTLLD